MQIVFATPGLSTDPNSQEGKSARGIIKRCAKAVGKARLEPGAVVFTIDKAFRKGASEVVNAKALEALMCCLTDLDSLYLVYKPQTPSLYDSGVFYARTEVWYTTPALYARGNGDCKSLAACRVAELRRAGVECRTVFRFDPGPDMTMFHILIMFPDATWECPSRLLGMVGPQELAS